MKLLKSLNLFLLTPLVLLFSSCSSTEKKEVVKEEVSIASTSNDLPAMSLVFANGGKKSAKELPGKSVLILFQPDCDHCQREAEDILNHLKAFRDYELYFISSASLSDIIKFSEDYDLNNQTNIHFAQTTVNDILNAYGPIEAPSLYLYSSEKKLIQSFNGEVAIDVVLQYI